MTQITSTMPIATPSPAPPSPASAPAESKSKSIKAILEHVFGSLPTLAVLVILGGLAFWGHHTGWTVPKFSSIVGAMESKPDDWCESHGVPDSQCVECNKSCMAPVKDYGWCREHRVHQCAWHHPDIAQLDNPPQPTQEDFERAKQALALTARPLNNSRCQNYQRRLQFATADAVEKAGIDVMPALQGPIVESVAASGQLTYDSTRVLHVASRAAGTIWRVERQIGDRVHPGDVLALVDSAEAGKAKSDLLQAIAGLELTQLTLARKQSAASGIPGRELQEAKAAVREAQVRLKAVQHVLANLGIVVNPVELAKLPEDELNERIYFLGLPAEIVRTLDPQQTTGNLVPVRSTIEGVVTNRDVVPGEVVDTAKELFVVTDARQMWLTLDVRAEDARTIQLGQTVRFRPDGGGDEVVGKITWLNPAIDEKTRTLKVRATVDNSAETLRAFTFGTGRIVLRTESNAVIVPNEAVQTEGCCRVVFVRDKNFLKDGALKVFHVREVQVGAQDEANTELIAGVLPGEIVATKGSGVLRSQLLKNNLGAG